MDILEEIDDALQKNRPIRREKTGELIAAFRQYITDSEARIKELSAGVVLPPPVIPPSALFQVPAPDPSQAVKVALQSVISHAEQFMHQIDMNMILSTYAIEAKANLEKTITLAKSHLR